MGNLKESPLTTRRLLRFRHVRLVLVTELLPIERFSLFSSTANVYQLYIYKYASPGSFFFNSHSQLSLSLLFLSVSHFIKILLLFVFSLHVLRLIIFFIQLTKTHLHIFTFQLEIIYLLSGFLWHLYLMKSKWDDQWFDFWVGCYAW